AIHIFFHSSRKRKYTRQLLHWFTSCINFLYIYTRRCLFFSAHAIKLMKMIKHSPDKFFLQMFLFGQKLQILTKMNIMVYLCILNQKTMVKETSTIAPVTFTTGAVKELLKLKDQQEIGEDFGLRIGVEGGGCSGLNYILGFDQKKEGDSEFLI